MQNSNALRAVVLAGDYSYIRQIETTLKSLLYHNSHLKVYIFNQDIPQEWFSHHRHLMRQIESVLIDVKLLDVGLDENWVLNHNLAHINYMTFSRYFIPRYVTEDTVLYLDSDLVVTQDLSPLWAIDLTDYYLAAVEAIFGLAFGFNAGVLLINNKRWREENICGQLIEQTNKEHKTVPEGDQTILNNIVGEAYLPLPENYNYPIGYDEGADYYGHDKLFDIPLDPLPAIVHYLSADKPWKTYSISRLRELWWHYHVMQWTEIFEKWQSIYTALPIVKRYKALTITDTANLLHLETLARACPEWEFHVVAFTDMAPSLLRLATYDNIKLKPCILGPVLKQLIPTYQAYLDIDDGEKNQAYLELVKAAGQPVLSFEETRAETFGNDTNHQIFSEEHPEQLVSALKKLIR